jgi:hypothetical protein
MRLDYRPADREPTSPELMIVTTRSMTISELLRRSVLSPACRSIAAAPV